jgi:hypothetical protein
MGRVQWFPLLGLVGFLAMVSSAHGQQTPYVGFVYPAGGQQGTTVQIRLGGQRIDGTSGAVVSGEGVSAKLAHYYRYLSNQEVTLLREQVRLLKKEAADEAKRAKARAKARGRGNAKPSPESKERQELIARIEKRMREWINRPACRALSSIAVIEVSIASDAEPGPREIRLITARGMSNPMPFHIGQVPEVARAPMLTARFQVLGKEAFSQRKRPPEEEEETVTIPCTMNGQIASGELNRYRFEARKGQQLVAAVDARSLVPYIADAVPGWFQPVVTICDANGEEVAYNDDFRFKPDPTLSFEVPEDGEYVLTITDAIYRGREDFVYRVTLGEVPYLTSIFPLGGRAGEQAALEMDGWNLENAKVTAPSKQVKPGLRWVTAKRGNTVSNRVPFAVDTLPECFDAESNNDAASAQQIKLPMIVNGRIDESDDWDVFQIKGKAGQTIVAEVHARRLESPMDSMLKLTDSEGKVLAFNDDHEDPGVGLNTHHADSYLRVKLPEDGSYFVHLGDTTRSGGREYAYRLRISAPRPDFALRVVPSGGGMRSKSGGGASVYVIRKDGFEGDIMLNLKDPPEGFTSWNIKLPAGKEMVRYGMKTSLRSTEFEPVYLEIQGAARIGDKRVVHQAVPAEDRMQAFLWRHLLPAEDLCVTVYNPSYQPPPTRIPEPSSEDDVAKAEAKSAANPPKFTKRQVAGRLRQLKGLYEEWLLTDDFYNAKVAECEAAL